ncbi:hypothetical protein [Spiroplasma apis]|uniref:Transmembrane protein n=1 Tax=Spiroplasma apis B31 TaxID=1276258 RepID=V5RJN6_SPIAP|nr:hypothetical protein [Spiroplasma apis]AHB36326.1 hypothetical protein SAPIS_v1c04810 [Spiroplasma apis B31]
MKSINFKIFNFNFKKLIKNRILIILTVVYLSISALLEIISFYNYFDITNKYFDKIDYYFDCFFFLKIIFDVILLSIIVIYIITLLFYGDKKEGKIDLEIKGGISVFQSFFSRFIIFFVTCIVILIFNLIVQSLLTLSISNYFIEAKLKVLSFFAYKFLLIIIVSALAFILLMLIKAKISLTLISILASLISVSQAVGGIKYSEINELYRYQANTFMYEKQTSFINKFKNDDIFTDIFESFKKAYNYTSPDFIQYQYGNYDYILEKYKQEAIDTFGTNYIDFIVYLNKLFDENYTKFTNYNLNGFKMEDTLTYNFRPIVLNFNYLMKNNNRIYNILNKVISLSNESKYKNILNALKDISNNYFEFIMTYKGNVSYPANSFIDYSINQGYFKNTLINYKTPDQFDLYYFISSMFFEITYWNNYYEVNYKKGIDLKLTPSEELLNKIKLITHINPFNQLSQLSYGNYFRENYKYYHDKFSITSPNNLFESPTTPLQYKYFIDTSNEEGPVKLENLEEQTIEFVNYIYLYFMYFISMIILWYIGYLKYKKTIKL